MNPLTPNLTSARHWKDIPQEVSRRAMSSEGRRRAWLGWVRTGGFVVIVAGLAWGGLKLASVFQEGPHQLPGAATASPLKDLVLVTDGVLDQAWLTRTLALPKGASLMGLDLFELRARLLASGQVRFANVTRNFPATLAVTLAERSPVARLQVQDQAGAARPMLVARDGVVFEGVGFDPKMVATLPWLAGVKLTRQGGVFQPVAGMEPTAELLAKAKLEAEQLYATWRSVSLARLASDGEIEVTTQEGARIIFGTNQDFFRQLANLDAILDVAKTRPDKALRVINLALGGDVPVTFDGATPQDPADPSASAVPIRAAASPALRLNGFNH